MLAKIHFALPGAAALGLILVATAALAQSAPQSAAVGFDARLQSQGIATELGPVAAVTGEPSGRYSFTQTVSTVSENLAIAPLALTPTLSLAAKGLTSHVASSGIGIDSRSSEGDNAVASANFVLNINPPPGSGVPIPFPALIVTAQEAISNANFNIVYPAGSFATGAARIGSLTVSGQLLDRATLKFSGPTAPNTVIYQSPTVTITVNRQIKSGVISCTASAGCTFEMSAIDVAAIDIALHNAPVGGSKVSGDILIGNVTAR
jgi:hypothetical protein